MKKNIDHIITIVPEAELPISHATLRELLKLCCQNVPFMFDGAIYEQFEGMAMGSNLAPTMAQFAMDSIESKIEAQKKPLFYKRFIDDLVLVFESESKADEFLHYFNTLGEIKFTMEKPQNNTIIFLDMEIKLANNRMTTEWHRKKTNIGLYTPASSFSPYRYKMAALRSVFYRIRKLSTNEDIKQNKYKEMKSVFRANGYSEKEIQNVIISVENDKHSEKEKEEKKSVIWKIQYNNSNEKEVYQRVHQINKKLVKTRIRIVFTTCKTSSWFPNKDRIPCHLASSVVYKYTCEHCLMCYIGETRRHLKTRIREHLSGHAFSEIFNHVHIPNEENFKVIRRTRHTKIMESICISNERSSGATLMNSHQSSVQLHFENLSRRSPFAVNS